MKEENYNADGYADSVHGGIHTFGYVKPELAADERQYHELEGQHDLPMGELAG